jgi:hypothetical protein
MGLGSRPGTQRLRPLPGQMLCQEQRRTPLLAAPRTARREQPGRGERWKRTWWVQLPVFLGDGKAPDFFSPMVFLDTWMRKSNREIV